jgi:hypothetical protein
MKVASICTELQNRVIASVLHWIEEVRIKDKTYGEYRLSAPGQATLMTSCFVALARELVDDLSSLSEQQQAEWISYIRSHQQPESGLFLDPLLKPEDLTHPGNDWTYLTMQLTYFSLSALDTLGSRTVYPLRFAEKYKNIKFLRNWLEGRNWAAPWVESNNIMFVFYFLVRMYQDTKDEKILETLYAGLDWLDKRQDPETGFWETNNGVDLLNAMAGAFHFYSFYFDLEREVKYIDRTIDSTLSLQHKDGLFHPWGGGGACHDLDAVDVLVKFSLLTDYRQSDVKAALTRAFEGILRNQNEDGGFCEAKNRTRPKSIKRRIGEIVGLDRLLNKRVAPSDITKYSGWNQMTYKIVESDTWSAWFRPLALALISSRYPGEFISNMNWKFRRFPGLGWHESSKILQSRH